MSEEIDTKINKIDIDNETLEPTIIELDAKDEPSYKEEQPAKSKRQLKKEERLSDRQFSRELGKQIVMRQVLGINPEEEDVSKRQKMFKKITTILFIVLIVAVLAVTAYHDFFVESTGSKKISMSEFIGSTWFYLPCALVALFCSFFMKGLKLSVMCKATVGKFHLKTCIETAIIGHYYNNITPLGAGGQPFEIHYLSKHKVNSGVAAALPIAAVFTYMFAFAFMGIVALIFFQPNHNVLQIPAEIINSTQAEVIRPLVIVGLICCMLTPTAVVLFCIMPKLSAKITIGIIKLGGKLRLIKDPEKTTKKTLKTVRHNATCLKDLASKPLVLLMTFLISICELLSLSSIAYFVLRFFNFDWPTWSVWEWLQVMQICVLLYVAISFIPTPGNSGAADISFYAFFNQTLAYGFAFPAMIVWRILSFYSYILTGFIFTTIKRKIDRKKERLKEERRIKRIERQQKKMEEELLKQSKQKPKTKSKPLIKPKQPKKQNTENPTEK